MYRQIKQFSSLLDESLILPCLGRTELMCKMASNLSLLKTLWAFTCQEETKSCPNNLRVRWIAAKLASETIDDSKIPWLKLVDDYDEIRNLIEKSIPGFEQYTND